MTSVNLAGYHLSFDAEMTSPADMSQFSTTYANGDRYLYGNYEAEYYADYNPASPSNPFSFAGGALTITASPTPVGSQPYTSGILTTANTFSQNTGYFEIRAEVPTGAGFWPAFWLLAPDYSSEVDIMEEPNNDGPTNYFTSVKTSGLNAGTFNNAGFVLSGGYHTYGFMWTPYTIQFTLDGQYIGYAVGTPAGLATAKTYLIANLGVGGQYSWPGTPAAGATAQYKIDYIRAYSNDPAVPTVAQEPVSPPDLLTLPSIGTGPDSLVLLLNEDAYQGDAMFTVSVDGVQQGGVMTASAIASASQSQSLTINGTFGTSLHTVSVNFLNDAWGGSSSMDRNLYVTQATIDGNAISGSALSLYGAGAQSFSFGNPAIVTLGSGPDVLALQVAQDQYLDNAQFTVSVDGNQIGGVQTATVSKASGATQTFDVLGNFATGGHTVSVDFLNDAWGGSSSTDRNLYVTQATIDGNAISGSALSLYGAGSQSFSFGSTTQLTLHVAEDAYMGDAQFIVSIDGTQLGGAQSVTALHSAGASQAFSFNDVLNAGSHDVAVSFINDAYGGPSLDRNLYVVGADLNGVAQNSTAWSANLYSNSTAHFSLVVPS